LSGEALAGRQGYGIDPDVICGIAAEVREVVELGVQVALVIGGGNIFRGICRFFRRNGSGQCRLHGDAGYG